MTDVAILGAGIAGLSLAWTLQKQGIDFTVLEKQAYVGGLARSFRWHGFDCDIAAHRLFSNDQNILQQLLNLTPMGRHVRRSRIYLGGHWMRDPLDVFELAAHLSLPHRLGVIWDYLLRRKSLPDDCFENFVLRRYGKSLYRLFFKPYTEKLFGTPGKDISAHWARQKVRLANPLDNFRENTKTKFAYFYYPIHGGYGAISERLYQEVASNVLTQAAVQGLEREDGQIAAVTYVHNGQELRLPVKQVVSTLPLTVTARLLGHSLPMHYRKVEAVYLLVNRPLVSENHWTYFINSDIAINRMVEFKNMSAVDTPPEKTVLCAEVTQEHPDVTAKVVADLERIGMIQASEVLDTHVVRENFAYPIYDRSYDSAAAEAGKIFSACQNLHLLGRAAEFRHREVDDNFAAAQETALRLAGLILGKPTPEMEAAMTPPPAGQARIMTVVLTYNHYDDTQECLQSVFALQGSQSQVVLVDNGSDDGTPERVRQEFPAVHVIENRQNLGVPAGYNVGFQYAMDQGADYILMLNNDTILPAELLSELLSVAEKDPQTGVVMPKVLYHGASDKVWSSGGRYRVFPPAILMTDKRKGMEDKMRLIEYAPSCALLIARRAFERAGLFDPGYFFLYDDWDFSERVRAHGLNIWYAPNAFMWHKVSTTTQGPRSPLYWRTYGASIARFWRRHGRPVWFSLPVHIGYVTLREFFFKGNWGYWKDFQQGIREGLQRPL
jgi:protoporphyrinogen oxidase/GT2 family glycosyltransferase